MQPSLREYFIGGRKGIMKNVYIEEVVKTMVERVQKDPQ